MVNTILAGDRLARQTDRQTDRQARRTNSYAGVTFTYIVVVV